MSLRVSKAASTDYDLTGQIVWPVSVFLSWFILKNRNLFEGKHAVELGAGCGLSGLVLSKFCDTVALTDGNEIVVELLQENCDSMNAMEGTDTRVAALLNWNDDDSWEAFCALYPHQPTVLIGADVVYAHCWASALLPTVKRFLDQVEGGVFFCGFVCRALDVKAFFLSLAQEMGLRVEVIPSESFVPHPVPKNMESSRELELLKFELNT